MRTMEKEPSSTTDHWFSDEDVAKVGELLKSGQLCGWWQSFEGSQYVKEFEWKFADYIGVDYALAVSNGTTAIYAALLACGVGKGDRVAVSPYTHLGSVAPIVWAGAEPYFVDVDANGNIDPEKLRVQRCNFTAVLAVHNLGMPCFMSHIREAAEDYCLVVEDAAQSLGSSYAGMMTGSIGEAGCFSLGGNMTKAISLGEAGVVTAKDGNVARKIMNLRNHGETQGADYVCMNFRLSELNALIGLLQLPKLQVQIEWQKRNAQYLIENLPEYLSVEPPTQYSDPCRYIVGCRFDAEKAGMTRDVFLAKVREKGFIGGQPRMNVGPGYQKLVYDVPFYSRWRRNCPNAKMLRKNAVWIDYHRYPRTKSEIDALLNCFKEVAEES